MYVSLYFFVSHVVWKEMKKDVYKINFQKCKQNLQDNWTSVSHETYITLYKDKWACDQRSMILGLQHE